MKFECPSCNKSGQVDDTRVPDEGMYATCPGCKTRFLVSKPVAEFTFEQVNPETRHEIPSQPHPTPIPPPPSQNEYKPIDRSQLYRIAIGKKADYYLPFFDKFDKNPGASGSWNWAAFFGGWIWACYRKMYKTGVIFFLLLFLLILLGKIDAIGLLTAVMQLGLQIYIGINANKLYYQHINEKIVMAGNDHKLLVSNCGVNLFFLRLALFFVGLILIGIVSAIVIPKFYIKPSKPNYSGSTSSSSPQVSNDLLKSTNKAVNDNNKASFFDLRNAVTTLESYRSGTGKYPDRLDIDVNGFIRLSDGNYCRPSNNVVLENYSVIQVIKNGQQHSKMELFSRHLNGSKMYRAICTDTDVPCEFYEKFVADTGENWLRIPSEWVE